MDYNMNNLIPFIPPPEYDIIYLTELSMVTNHFSWEHSDNEELCGIYCELYFRCRDYAYGDNFPEHEVLYYYRCTD